MKFPTKNPTLCSTLNMNAKVRTSLDRSSSPFKMKHHRTCVLCLGSLWMVNTELQVEELHDLLLEVRTRPHVRPHVQ